MRNDSLEERSRLDYRQLRPGERRDLWGSMLVVFGLLVFVGVAVVGFGWVDWRLAVGVLVGVYAVVFGLVVLGYK